MKIVYVSFNFIANEFNGISSIFILSTIPYQTIVNELKKKFCSKPDGHETFLGCKLNYVL